MSARNTRFVGPLGSTIHHLRADAATVAAVAALDWNRRFRRVWLDPLRGVITLMSPSRLHENRTGVFESVVEGAAKTLALAASGLRHTRLRRSEEPPGTGPEPDAAFYLGERARAYWAAEDEGEASADAFVERVGPDLVVEVEVTHADAGKVERYRDLGVREFWRVRGSRGSRARAAVEVSFFSLTAGSEPKPLEVSTVLPGLLPVDVRQAVEAVRRSRDPAARIRVVERIVRRRQQQGIRVREERAEYRVGPRAASRITFPCACSLHDSAPAVPASDTEPTLAAKPATCFVGPLGSTIHHLRADAETVLELAGLDWDRRFRRARLDPAQGVITLTESSRLREELSGVFQDIVEGTATTFGRPARGLRHARLRRAGDPPGAGVEADGAFYVGERASAYRAAFAEGAAAAEAFVERTGPDLVVEVEVTHADEGKIEQYAALGAREYWRIRGERDRREVEPEFLAIGPGVSPRPLAASAVLPGLTPRDAGEVAPRLRRSPSVLDRMRIVTEMARRRKEQRDGARDERAEHPVEAAAASLSSSSGASLPARTASTLARPERKRAAS